MTSNSQYVFTKEKIFLTNLITSCGEISVYVDAGKAVDVTYLEFRKAFDTVKRPLESWTRQEDYGKSAEWSGLNDSARVQSPAGAGFYRHLSGADTETDTMKRLH